MLTVWSKYEPVSFGSMSSRSSFKCVAHISDMDHVVDAIMLYARPSMSILTTASRNAHLGAIAGQVANHSSAEELDVRALFADVRPLLHPEAADARPVLGLVLPQAVEQNVERDADKVVPDNHVRVRLLQQNCT